MLDEVMEVCKYGHLDTFTDILPGERYRDVLVYDRQENLIEDYTDHYQVTNYGRVWSIKSGTFLTQCWSGKGSDKVLDVNLWRNGIRRHGKVHKLVLWAFVGFCPIGLESRHLDGNRENNNLDNLIYGTHSENEQDKYRHGTENHTGENNPMCDLCDIDILKIRDLYSLDYFTQYDLAEMFEVRQGTISRIINGIRRGNI